MEKSSDNSTAFNRISTNILLLGLVSFLNDLSSEMIMPILPMFISALGGGGLVVGLVGGLRDSIASILKVVCGYWSDKTGNRKIFVYLGYGISTVFKFVLAFSRIWQQAVAFAAAERVGKGLRSAARDAIIADSATGARGRGFGHGLGMCQTGAKARADDGDSYRNILKAYYRKVKIVKLY